MHDHIIRLRKAAEIAGISRSTLLRLEASGDFPKKIRLSPKSVGWLASDIQDWIQKKYSKK